MQSSKNTLCFLLKGKKLPFFIFFACLNFFIFLVGIPAAWAQPSSIEVLDDATIGCEGKIRLRFQVGFDDPGTSDDSYVDWGNLYIKDKDGERHILHIDGNDYDEVGWSRRSESLSHLGYIEDVQWSNNGRVTKFLVTIENLVNRDDSDIEFKLDYKWDEHDNSSSTTQSINKKNFLNANVLTATRDDCRREIVQMKVNGNSTCHEDGFDYRIVLEKSVNSDFSNATVLRSQTIASNVQDAFVFDFADTTGLGDYFYRSILTYKKRDILIPTICGTAICFQNFPGAIYQSDTSQVINVMPYIVTPPVLDSVSNNICDSTIILNWSYNTNQADRFEIFRTKTKVNDTTYTNYTKIGEVDGSKIEYTDKSNVQSDTVYSYAVKAVELCKENTYASELSNSIEGFSPDAPTNPSDLVVTVQKVQNQIHLKWIDNADDEIRYVIERRFGDAKTIFYLPPDSTEYIDKSILPCRTYEYDIFSENVCGKSERSVQGTARLEPILDNALSTDFFEASKGKFKDRVQLSWTPQNNTKNLINRYRVFRKRLGESDSLQIDVVSGTANLYRDQTADAGVIYEYTLVGETNCEQDVLSTNTVKSIGFRTATGLISGQVSYEGGNAVQGAKILVSPADGTQRGRSIQLDGLDDKVVFESIDLANQSFTIEFWAKRNTATAGTIVAHGANMLLNNQNLAIGFKADGKFSFDFGGNELVSAQSYNNTDWQHWTCVYDGTTKQRSIYLNDVLIATDNAPMAYMGNGVLQFGVSILGITNPFNGHLDELRIWKEAKDSTTVVRDYERILNGNEDNILLSLSFDEGIGTGVYDRSKTGIFFNEHHGQIEGVSDLITHWSMNTPTPEQLGLFGLTDNNGSYIIAAIPYSGNGQIFKVVPQFLTHQFEPKLTNVFIGESSDVHNNINFTDVSSFPVTGTVFYKGTSCPSEAIEILIDGEPAKLNGEIVKTNATGTFSVDVPIGRHRISLQKEGHTFEVGRWPTDGSLYDFQEPISGIEFIDATQLNIVGRVVGGTREGNKVPGLGRSNNNIGVARIIFESVAGNGCHRDTVFTDSKTGEYQTNLYPLEYTIDDIRVMHPDQNISIVDFGVLPLLKLVNVGIQTTVKDTVYQSGTTTIDRIDSTSYHFKQDFIYRNVAEIEVLEEDEMSDFFGEEMVYINELPVAIKDKVLAKEMYPIFHRGTEYRAKIKVFEKYTNYDTNKAVDDKVPVTDGTIIINNTLAADSQQVQTIAINDGDTLYMFNAGRPNLQQDPNQPAYDFTKTMDITLSRPSQVQDVKWYPNEGDAIDERIFRGYILGFQAIEGTNFVSQGPEKVDFVLRDPPGSGSTASFSEESTFKIEHNFNVETGAGGQLSKEVKGGTKFEAGIGVSTEVEVAVTAGSTFEIEAKVGGGGVFETSTTTSKGYSTSGANEAVGVRGDVYVGTTFNVNFGMSKTLEVLHDTICGLPNVECISLGSLPFNLGKRTGFYATPSEAMTTFAYTQNHIVNYLIPNLESLRDGLFQSEKYTSKVDGSNENFGSNNDDPAWGDQATPKENETNPEDRDGPSYTWNGMLDDYGIGTDSVRWYNQQIRLWEQALAENEKDKFNAINDPSKKEELISFDAAVSISRSHTSSSSESGNWELEVATSKEFQVGLALEAGGSGASIGKSLKISGAAAYGGSTSDEESTTWAYELSDGDQGDAFSVQIYKSPNGWGPIFQTISGQTSCPHEPEVETEYYLPGTMLSNRTLQIEKIGVDIFPKLVQNVPEGEVGVFNMQLENLSESSDDIVYAVRVDPASNPHGLRVLMDGQPLTKTVEITVPGGGVITKTLAVQRGPERYEYNDIRLIAFSPCQFQAGTSDEEDIMDETFFSVSFLPECTPIRLKEPEDKWVLNNYNNDSLLITIDDYDINKNGFESVSLQYRPAAESRWVELQKWWHPVNKSEEEGTKIPADRSFIRYFWEMNNFVDGDYHLRVVSECELADNETAFSEGHADRINPHPFGTPSPGDGVADPGEDIKIKFNEPIEIGSLTSLNFDIRGVLNGTPLRHQESVAFDGQNDYGTIPAYDLTKRSFAVEFWAKLNGTGTGTVLSQGGLPEKGLFVGFDSQNKFQFALAGTTITADQAIPMGEWKHFVASYDYGTTTASLFVDGVEVKVSNSFNGDYVGTGDLAVGKTIGDGSKLFNGNVHELRLWSKTRSTINIVPNMNISLSPTTRGLIGYWSMNEGVGQVINDKVRSRHGNLTGASWTILPLGQAFQLNGSSDYLEIENAGTLIFSEEADFTIEAWFKGTSAGTILSNGKGDGSSANQDAWAINLDDSGKIIVQNDGQSFASNIGGYLDDNWHHFSFVMDRDAATYLYIDGQLVKTGDSRGWKAFGASKLWIGCRGDFVGSTEERDQYFAGSLDDIRLWNTARQAKQIERDWVHRLSGDELGLMAYFPFEDYRLDAGVPVLEQSLADASMEGYDLSLGGSTTLNYTQPTPPIKLPRPIQKVNFNYSVNQDEIILTPTDPSGRMEHVTLDISVKNVKDHYGNPMESPATWIAFMNKNQVYWDRETVELETNFGEAIVFETEILNTGGSPKHFEILNLPYWLVVDEDSDLIAPNSSLKVKFTVSAEVNIGTYEEDILLSTDFGFNERLLLKLKVAATPPEWVVNSNRYLHSMSYVGQLVINEVVSTDEEDMIGVFIKNELRGVANVEIDPVTNKPLVFLDVYSNEVTGEPLEFRIWNASEGRVHIPVTPTDHTFNLHDFRGSPSNPIDFEAIESVIENYTLEEGWNWISFPLTSSILSDVNETFLSLNPEKDDRILSQNYVDVFTETNGWTGTLSLLGNGFNRKEGYKVFLSNAGTFSYSGALGNPNDEPIALNAGWNWIGFIGGNLMDINTALASLDPSEGDVIKGQRRFAIYEEGRGWNGSLDFLSPTEGYMIKLANPGVLRFPNRNQTATDAFNQEVTNQHSLASTNTAQLRSSTLEKSNRLKVLETRIRKVVQSKENNLSLVATIEDCQGNTFYESNTLLGAFVGKECRGIAPLEWTDNKGLSYLMVHGQAGEKVNFKLMDTDYRIKTILKEAITFEDNVLHGRLINPKVLHVGNCLSQADALSNGLANSLPEISKVQIFPNPFNKAFTVQFELPQSEKVSIVLRDVTGREITSIYQGFLEKGQQQFVWKEAQVGQLSEGVYLLTIQSNSIEHTAKLIK